MRELAVSYSYDRPPVAPGVPGNACDIGIFDERGTAVNGRGFRGWSGDSAPRSPSAAPRNSGVSSWPGETWRTTAAGASYVRAEVRHPRADGTPGPGGNGVGELPFGPMAAMTNPVFITAAQGQAQGQGQGEGQNGGQGQ